MVKANLADDRISLKDVFIGAAPFAAIMAVALALVIAFPALSLFLVR